jgi:hypothetical protein
VAQPVYVTGHTFFWLDPDNFVSYANPYNTTPLWGESGIHFTVDEYPGTVAYYLYSRYDSSPIPTSNNPADWTGWSTNETSKKRTSAGTFDYAIMSGLSGSNWQTIFVVAKFANNTYTNPTGVSVNYLQYGGPE